MMKRRGSGSFGRSLGLELAFALQEWISRTPPPAVGELLAMRVGTAVPMNERRHGPVFTVKERCWRW